MAAFALGRIAATPGALRTLATCCQVPATHLARHEAGDFGEAGAGDAGCNRADMRAGSGRVLSAYTLRSGERLWIITNPVEQGQKDTCLLLLHEY